MLPSCTPRLLCVWRGYVRVHIGDPVTLGVVIVNFPRTVRAGGTGVGTIIGDMFSTAMNTDTVILISQIGL